MIFDSMIPINFFMIYRFTRLVSSLRGGLHGFCELGKEPPIPAYPTWGVGRCCNSLEWKDHSASLRLALHTIFHGLQAIESRSPLVGHRKNRAIHPVQLRFPG